ncbi:MAG: 50S ribosomal protein L10 [Puniceicoccales bacterium]|jgi:large subunit ribosomal protein L10|nr:50S ribosomal protein L10 [Puniceicoccales bacterium]
MEIMREEKKFLTKEVREHIEKSDYLYVAGFDRLTVENVTELRKALRDESAEYHVVKNSILQLAAREAELPEIEPGVLRGTTAIVSGGKNPSGVAKALNAFISDPEKDGKLFVKWGRLGMRVLCPADIMALSKLPSLDVLRAQMLSLLQAALQQFLAVCNAAAQSFVRLLNAYGEKQPAG